MPTPKPNLDSLFQAVLEIETPEAQAAFLLRACGDDVSLRTDVERLLKSHQNAGSFLEHPAPEYFAAGHIDARKRVEKPVDVTLTSRSDLDSLATLQTEVNDCPPATASDQRSHEMAGELIAGKYQLIELIGEGGMGSVWRAKQSEPIKRFVAVKLIKAGRDSRELLSRFNIERQALALMEHPNIAKVLDGGLHQNRPYFVMELVKGLPITEYCDKCRLTPLSRLELFVFVCQAIQHAHHKGIIHRDIKPSNVLVALYDERPVVKVIDFGVAKATAEALIDDATLDTAMGTIVGTPQYMSPEQATLNNLDIDTRSDIYSLGVLLYELLTGSPPFSRLDLEKRGLLEMLRIVREEEPPRPSQKLSTADALPTLSANRGTEPKTLTGLLRNELDWIVMKALEKDRTRRYETANGFSADVLRYLSGETVQAHPPSAIYRVMKFVRRHRVEVVAASLTALALVAGVIGTTLGLFEANRQRDLAQLNEVKALNAAAEEKAAKQRESERADGERNAKNEAEAQKKKAIEFRDKALNALRAATGEDVEKLIGAKTELSANEKNYLEAIARRWQTFAEEEGTDERTREIQSEGHYRVGFLWLQLGRLAEAQPEYERAVALQEKLAAEFPAVSQYRQDLAQSHRSLGMLLRDLGKLVEAEEHHRQALALRENLVAEFHAVPQYRRDLAYSYNSLGILLSRLGKKVDAEEQQRQALALRENLATEFPAVPKYRDDLAGSHTSLGVLLSELGEGVEAEMHDRRAVAVRENLAADFPAVPEYRRELASSHNNLGFLLSGLGRPVEAEEQYRLALALIEKLAAEFPAVPRYRRSLASTHNNLGALLPDLDKRVEAEEHYLEALALQKKLAIEFPGEPEYRQELSTSHNNLGLLLEGLGRRAEAQEMFRHAIALKETLATEWPAVPEYRRELAASHNNLGTLLMMLQNRAEAEEQFRQAIALDSNLVAEYPDVPQYRQDLATSHNSLGMLLSSMGKRANGQEQFRQAIVLREKLAAEYPDAPEFRTGLGVSYCNLGVLMRDGGNPTDSLRWFAKAISVTTPNHQKKQPDVTVRRFLRDCYLNRAVAFDQLWKYAEAIQDWDKVIELSSKEEQPGMRASRATSRLRAGQVAEAAAEVEELVKSPNWNANQWYNFARLYAVASKKIADRKQEYGDRAMELLQQAAKAGYKNAAQIKKDTDVAPLRDRDDFKKLIADLEKAAAVEEEPEKK